MGTVGEVFIYLMPVLLGSVADSFSLAEGTAGLLIALEVGASALSAILFSLLIDRWRTRRLGLVCISVVIIGDFTSSIVSAVELFAGLRVITAFGAGALFAIANSLAARARDAHRIYAALGFCVIITATLGFMIITFAIEQFGPQAAFAALAVLTALGLPFFFWLPDQPASRSGVRFSRISRPPHRGPAIAMCLAIFLLYVGQNAVWAFAERIGAGAGLALPQISAILIANGFLALLGPLAAHRLGTRAGNLIPLVIAIVVQICAMVILVRSSVFSTYAASLITLSLAFVFGIPYLRSIMADLDETGRIVGASTAFVSIGAAVGPGFGGIVLNLGGGYTMLGLLSAALLIISLAVIVQVTRAALPLRE